VLQAFRQEKVIADGGGRVKGTYLDKKSALTNQVCDSPASRSREIVGKAVEMTVDSRAVKSEVTERPAMITRKRQPRDEDGNEVMVVT
jgi:hypothetical protein